MSSLLKRLEALEAAERNDFDIDAVGQALGLSADDIAEAKAFAASIPPGTSLLEVARLAGEPFGIHPADILAEARQIMALAEGLA